MFWPDIHNGLCYGNGLDFLMCIFVFSRITSASYMGCNPTLLILITSSMSRTLPQQTEMEKWSHFHYKERELRYTKRSVDSGTMLVTAIRSQPSWSFSSGGGSSNSLALFFLLKNKHYDATCSWMAVFKILFKVAVQKQTNKKTVWNHVGIIIFNNDFSDWIVHM